MSILIKHGWILTMDACYREYRDGDILIEDDKITYIGESIDALQADEVIDAAGKIVIPGMINTHCHASMVPFRSLGDDCPDRLRRFLFPLELSCMNESLAYLSAKYGILEMVSAGITTFADMYYFMDKVALACEEIGIRGVLGETIINQATCDSEEVYGGLALGEEFIKTWRNSPMITPILAPHATNTNEPQVFERAMDIVKKYNTMMMTHVAEMDYEMKYFRDNYDMTPIEWLDSIHCLNPHLLAVHCIHLNAHDIELMAKRGVNVSHCVGSNLKAGKGIAPIRDLRAKRIAVGLGTDGASSGNTLDLFTQMRLMPCAQKTKYHDRSLFPAKQVVRMATLGGAEALHMEEFIGSLEVSKKADITIVDTSSLAMFPIHDPYSALVYSASASDVCDVIIDGLHILKDRKTKHDSKALRYELDIEMQDFNRIAKEQSEAILK